MTNKVAHNVPKFKTIHQADSTSETDFQEEMSASDMRIELIQALISLGLEAVAIWNLMDRDRGNMDHLRGEG